MTVDIESWWAAGERIPVRLGDAERRVWARRTGSGPPMTLLHGFPSSSHDYAGIAGALAERHTLLLLDFLGFGASDKPVEHEYSLHEQADLVEAVWRALGVDATIVVGHDYAVSVTQELLARRAGGTLEVDLVSVHLLNGGLYPDIHRPEPVQTALLDPDQGPALSAALNEELLRGALAPTLGPHLDPGEIAPDMWRGLDRDGGGRLLHRLIRYILDRRTHEQRWVTALETTDVPLSFVWGMLDPISGAHMADRIRERLPDAPFLAMDDVGHWPPLEAPERVAAALLGPQHGIAIQP
jgi:pimeloyl-ACP methyl ester carboxylesterase